MAKRHSFLTGTPIDPKPVTGSMTVAELVDSAFLAYNAARLREACQLFVEKMLEDDVTIGMSLTGALTPAGLGKSCLIPLMKAGSVFERLGSVRFRFRQVHAPKPHAPVPLFRIGS